MKAPKEEEYVPVAPPVDNTVLKPTEQAVLAERLQAKWLRRMEFMLDKGLISATDMATLARVLLKNGWEFDLAKLPKRLGDKLTSQVDTEEMDEQDGIIPFDRKAQSGQ